MTVVYWRFINKDSSILLQQTKGFILPKQACSYHESILSVNLRNSRTQQKTLFVYHYKFGSEHKPDIDRRLLSSNPFSRV